jgi:hypothetical protein
VVEAVILVANLNDARMAVARARIDVLSCGTPDPYRSFVVFSRLRYRLRARGSYGRTDGISAMPHDEPRCLASLARTVCPTTFCRLLSGQQQSLLAIFEINHFACGR